VRIQQLNFAVVRAGHQQVARRERQTATRQQLGVMSSSQPLHRIASHRIASHRIASHRIASHRIASHRIASHHIATQQSAQH
jgi:nicotinic acid mononucleotide adenylyltransferase